MTRSDAEAETKRLGDRYNRPQPQFLLMPIWAMHIRNHLTMDVFNQGIRMSAATIGITGSRSDLWLVDYADFQPSLPNCSEFILNPMINSKHVSHNSHQRLFL
jgi:hypothetical protein